MEVVCFGQWEEGDGETRPSKPESLGMGIGDGC